jgi:hypothetical protein
VTGFFSIREYLKQFVADQASKYLERLRQDDPKDYIAPRITPPHQALGALRTPAPTEEFLKAEDSLRGGFGILTAEPGQGKTYHTKHLAARLAQIGRFPVYVHSDQWTRMDSEDFASLSRVIAHSFRFFQCPIAWMDGCEDEFFRVTLKAGLFSIVFDGFDEFILRNGGRISSIEALQSLVGLLRETGAKILVTARSSFWESELAEVAESEEYSSLISMFRIEPFDKNHARTYFERRRQTSADFVNQSLAWFDALQSSSDSTKDFVGRGFVLRLISDVVERTGRGPGEDARRLGVVDWLIRALCERETLRQQLPLSADQQLDVLRWFAEEFYRSDRAVSTGTLRGILELVAPELTADQLSRLLGAPDVPGAGSLRDHPLIRKQPHADQWVFVEEQVALLLLANSLLTAANPAVLAKEILSGRREVAGELAASIVDRVSITLSEADGVRKLREVVGSLSGYRVAERRAGAWAVPTESLAGALVIGMLNRLCGHKSKEERGRFLRDSFTDGVVAGCRFTGTLLRLDCRGVKFADCGFDGVTWVSCMFDASTTFDRCSFSKGQCIRTAGLGLAVLSQPELDAESRAMFREAHDLLGRASYTREDLRTDLEYLVRKFQTRDLLGLKTIKETDLFKGNVGASQHGKEILAALKKRVLMAHTISGISDVGVNVREEARPDVAHFFGNGVLVGVLAQTFDELCKRLRL